MCCLAMTAMATHMRQDKTAASGPDSLEVPVAAGALYRRPRG